MSNRHWANVRIGRREATWIAAKFSQPADFTQAVLRRMAGEPLAYVLGEWDFMGKTFEITRDTLIPRPDTEEWLAQLIDEEPDRPLRVVELGTGSGVIAITLAQRRPSWEITAVDQCRAALRVAQRNARRHQVSVTWRQGNWWQGLGQFDLAIANPPYIANNDGHLFGLRHEPTQALVAGCDGMADIHPLIAGAPQHVANTFWLEHGLFLAAQVASEFSAVQFIADPVWLADGRCVATKAVKK